MARRASAKPGAVWFILVGLLFMGGIGGGVFFLQEANDPNRTVQQLNVQLYYENANSLRGNVYKIEGTIQNALAFSPSKGRLYSVEVTTSVGSELLPVLIPAELNHIMVQKGQRFNIRIEIVEAGVIVAQSLDKV